MRVTVENPSLQAPRRRPLRLVGGGLFLSWAIFLAITAQFPASVIAGMVGVLLSLSYFARRGDPRVRRGSFLIGGALFFCAFLLGEFFVIAKPCTGQDPCTGPELVGVVAWVALTLTSAGAAVTEISLGFRPTEERERWTRRLVIGAFAAFGILSLLIWVADLAA